jgi:DNA-binding NtrC family response regulator
MRNPILLIVDDEPSIFEVMIPLAKRAGFDVVTCRSGVDAITYFQTDRADLAAVDLQMPGLGGIDVLRAIRQVDPDCQVMLMSGAATIDSAVEAVKLGAVDYLTKPFDFARLKDVFAQARKIYEHRRKLVAADSEVAEHAEFCGMVGRSAPMQELFSFIRRVAPHVRSALITGETGSGKELVARALHQCGRRRAKRFVTINCSAVVESLFESELFGHMRGAFTGATENKPGLFEAADGGTIFLDEIGELSLTVQAKLLRVLEGGEVQRVGSLQSKKVDVHVVAATNRDLAAEAAAGRFRNDLFYRLNVVELHVPPLRARREDIPYLTAAFIHDAARRLEKQLIGSTPTAESALMALSWPGNVRELRNTIERACILTESEFITERDLTGVQGIRPSESPQHDLSTVTTGDSLAVLERAQIVRVLEKASGNKLKAAKMLGVDRRALYRKLEEYGLDVVAKREKA